MVEGGELRSGKLRLDLESHEVSYGSHLARVTPIEFRILYQLMLHPGRVVSNERLIEYAWGYNGVDAGTLKMHISRIRQKLERAGPAPDWITSVRWVGYVLKDTDQTRGRKRVSGA